MVLKIFGLTRQQWDQLPWHDQRMYIEQFNEDPEFNGDEESNQSDEELSDWGQLPPGV